MSGFITACMVGMAVTISNLLTEVALNRLRQVVRSIYVPTPESLLWFS